MKYFCMQKDFEKFILKIIFPYLLQSEAVFLIFRVTIVQ